MTFGLGALHCSRSIDVRPLGAGGASRDYGPRGRRRSRLLRVDEHEGDTAGLGPAIDPGVIGALLHQHIARLEMNLRVVEQHVDLAGHHYSVVHGARAMHGGMPRRQSALGRTIAEALMHSTGSRFRVCAVSGGNSTIRNTEPPRGG